jgi:hypothetical protein
MASEHKNNRIAIVKGDIFLVDRQSLHSLLRQPASHCSAGNMVQALERRRVRRREMSKQIGVTFYLCPRAKSPAGLFAVGFTKPRGRERLFANEV